jgi:UDP-glucose 4-epimerase
MKILITGGAGFIAGHTIEAALKAGHTVVTNIRSNLVPEHLIQPGVEVYNVDSRDYVGMRQIIEKVDGVINLAGVLGTRNVTDWEAFYDNNVKTAWFIIEACLEFDTKLVQIAVGNHFEHNLYSNTKTAVERDVLMCAQYRGLKANVVRGLNAFGERQKVKNTGKIMSTFITNALKGEDLPVYGGEEGCGIMDMIYVKDLGEILVDVLVNPKTIDEKVYGNVYEAGTGVGYTVYDIAKRIIKLSKSKSEVVEVPMRAGENLRSKVVASKPYDFDFTDFDEALLNTIEYYKNL